MKRLLLLFLILSSNLFAEQGETILIIPQDICDIGNPDPFPYNLVDIEKEIAAFEAQLNADQAVQEMMAEIEAEAEFEAKTKAKLPKLQPTVCERNEGGYEAYAWN